MGHNAGDILAARGVVLKDDELAHYGKKGMKWGKRKSKSSSDDSDDDTPKKPDVKKMSDADLKASIARLKMEKEFATLTAPQISQGRKIVGNILLDVGKQQAKDYLNREITKMIVGGGAKALLKAGAKGAAKGAAKNAVPVARTLVTLNKRF